MTAKKPYDENSPEVQPQNLPKTKLGKVDFNKEEDLIGLAKELHKGISEEVKKQSEDKGYKNAQTKMLLAGFMPFIKQFFIKRPSNLIIIILLIECLLYGIISQSYSLIRFIINLF